MSADDQSAQLAAALGVPFFSTGLYMPEYREACIGQWKLTRTGFCLDHGYYSGLCGVSRMPVLMRTSNGVRANGQDWETWMSLSPHEIESQELGCRYAFGHTAVMGLGMGWVAVNMALNPAVTLVTVVERDPEVVDLFGQSQALDGLPAEIAGKIRIVRADALEWKPDKPVDFLYADIWRCLEEPQTLDDVRRMQSNVGAGGIYFWGQELAIHTLAAKRPEGCADNREWAKAVRHCVADIIRLPLLLPDDFDYPGTIAEVVRRRRERRPDSVKKEAASVITLRPITDDDQEFLYQLYASIRAAEKELVGWTNEQWDEFLRMQFYLQHTQYQQNYRHPSLDIIMEAGVPVGRFYVDRRADEYRLIDIAVLPEFRRRGIAGLLLKSLLREAEANGLPVSLHVERNNPILGYYQEVGFRIEEDKGIYLFMVRPTAGIVDSA